MKTTLFTEIQFRDLKIKNRIAVSPMCQYSAQDGVPNEWHLVHLGSRAVGGAGLVIAEATAVVPEGRISYADLGLWNEKQEHEFKKITTFIKAQGATPGIQLAHAGRKASTDKPWVGGDYLLPAQGGWNVVGPSTIPFKDGAPIPEPLSKSDIQEMVTAFTESTKRALRAGFEVIELHMAHGYLFHQFLSPFSNHRKDEFGGSLENRMRFPLMVAEAVRGIIPSNLPLFVRISATDWKEGGWDLEQSITFCKELKRLGVDLIDVSTGGAIPGVKIPLVPHYQVPFARDVKKAVNIKTAAVGLITDPVKAQSILEENEADMIFLARELLRDPYWPLHAAKTLGVEIKIPSQYERAFK